MRPLIQIGVAIAIAALVVRTWLVQGIVDPLVVSGGSMAPTLMGAHRHVVCHDCRFAFDVDEQSLPADLAAICPNCGAPSDLSTALRQPGDRLLIDRTAYGTHDPARWDVVVLRAPDDPGTLSVKRVVGMPGETIELREGDVYIDDQPARRSLEQILAMASVVYDASHRPPSVDAAAASHHSSEPDSDDWRVSRWRPERARSYWQRTAEGFEFAPDADTDHFDWLAYEHRQTHGRDLSRPAVGPILDDLAYNQNESRELIAVPDVILRARLSAQGSGSLWLRADDGRQTFEVQLDVESGNGQLFAGDTSVLEFAAGRQPLRAPTEIVLALVDAQLRLAIDGRTVLDYFYDPAGIESRPASRPLAIGSAVVGIRLTSVEVLRDVYYLPSATGGGGQCRLAADEYWLLGDNSPVSVDSRQWSAVPGNLFVGKALIRRRRP